MDSGTSILLFFGLLIVLGTLGGEAARRLRLPALTGQILVGILLGESGLNLLTPEIQETFRPLSIFALSLVAVTIGGHLEFRRLQNARRRILLISAGQTTVTFLLVFLVFQALNPLQLPQEWKLPVHLLVASISTSTSPATPLHIIKEKRAKGLLVKTTIAVVAMNNLATIAIFDILHAVSNTMLSSKGSLAATLLPSGAGVGLSLAAGAGIGAALVAYCNRLNRTIRCEEEDTRHRRNLLRAKMFTAFLVALSLNTGLCEYLEAYLPARGFNVHPSPILANMVLGLVLANMSAFKEELLGLFDVLENAMFTCFFVLAGTHFDLTSVGGAWPAALLYFFSCLAGKWGGAWMGAKLNRSTEKMARYIGGMLLVQAAIAIALVVIVQQDPLYSRVSDTLTTCILAAVVATELVGGPVTSFLLEKSREAQKDRVRLIEFLQEEFILCRMRARDKWEAIEELCWFFCSTHKVDLSPAQLFQAVKEREEEIPTGLGLGVAVPHARIPGEGPVLGVLGKLEDPVDYGAPDGLPVRLMVLVATPEGQDHTHLEIMGALAAMAGNDRIRNAIFQASSAEEIHEIISSEEAETFNYFLEG